MSAIEILCRRNANGIDTQSAGRSSRINLELYQINAACHGIDDVTQCLIDAYVCDDKRSLARLKLAPHIVTKSGLKDTGGLFNDVLRLVFHVKDRNQWQIKEKGEDKIRALTRMALETVSSQPVCRACQGTKYINAKPCTSCSATGIKRDNGHTMAKRLGVSQSTWSRTWQYRFADVMAMLETVRSEGERKIIRQLHAE